MKDDADPATDLEDLFRRIRDLAVEYYRKTGKPLGVTGEVAEYEAARLLGMELCGPREPGYDAYCVVDGERRRYQVKGARSKGKHKPGARIGKLGFKHEWEAAVLVLLDAAYAPVAMYEAPRDLLLERVQRPGSKARNERGQLSIAQFKSVARLVWPPPRA